MFWTIVLALVFVFVVLPLVWGVLMAILSAIFDGSETFGWIALVVFVLIVLVIIF